MKGILRKMIKLAAIAWSGCVRQRSGGICFLVYHKVGGQLSIDIDLPSPLFRRQLDFLRCSARVTSYDQALKTLQNGHNPTEDLYVLTFDDGYEDFYTDVFPLLVEYNLPAILFVTTGFIETGITPLSAQAFEVRAITWEMAGEMQKSGLVTFGAHTHSHPTLANEPTERVIEELERPIQIFREQVGSNLEHFAYPRGVWDARTERLVSERYRSAVIGTGVKAIPANFDPYRIPRIPIRASDGWIFFRAKLGGWLDVEEQQYAILRQLSQAGFDRK